MCRTMNAESAGLDLGAWGANSPVRATCDVANREHMASVCAVFDISRYATGILIVLILFRGGMVWWYYMWYLIL